LGYTPAALLGAIALFSELVPQLIEERLDPVLLNLGDRDAVNPGGAAVLPHLLPRSLQHIPAMDAVPERVEASIRRPLGRQVQLDLEFSDLVLLGVVGPLGHAPVLPSSSNTDEAEPLPSPEVVLSSGYERYYGLPATLPAGRDFTAHHRLYAPIASRAHDRRPGAGEGFPTSRTDLSDHADPSTPGGS
jgi:hypothetical protein